jgi:hypothetical protein
MWMSQSSPTSLKAMQVQAAARYASRNAHGGRQRLHAYMFDGFKSL